MAHINKSVVALRIGGDTLIPTEIADLLGCVGTTMYTRGDVKVFQKSGREIIRKQGLWLLEAEDREPENIDGQVKELLSKLTSDLAVWDEISTAYSVDIFCGIFMNESNEGMEISPNTLSELGSRGILLALDVYDGSE